MDLIEHLTKINNKKIAEFWCNFNVWKYPPELERFKPKNWDLLPKQMKFQILKPINDYIYSRLSEKELLREWNKDRMKGVEFNIWWENRKPLSDLAKTILNDVYKLENNNLN